MPKCPRCNKTVYYVEKVSSQGKDWHVCCLKCGKCNKDLAGSVHSDSDGTPYCIPCYTDIFGPK